MSSAVSSVADSIFGPRSPTNAISSSRPPVREWQNDNRDLFADYTVEQKREMAEKEKLMPDATGELYRQDGSRPLKVGDIIEVHSGPVIFRRKAPKVPVPKGKKGKKTASKFVPTPVTIAEAEEYEVEDEVVFESGMFDENENGNQGVEDDYEDNEAAEEGLGLAIEEVRKFADDTPVASDAAADNGAISMGTETQTYIDFITVDNPIYEGSKVLADLAETLGIPDKTVVLGEVTALTKIYDTGNFYQETRLMRVGPGGILMPLKGQTIQVGERDPRSIPSIPIDPALLRPIRKNPYSEKYPIGERVRFSNPRFTGPNAGRKRTDASEDAIPDRNRYAYGIITAANDTHLTVTGKVLEDDYSRPGAAMENRRGETLRQDPPRMVSYVKYSDPNLQLAPRYGSLIEVNDLKKTRGIVVAVGQEGVVYFPVKGDSRRSATSVDASDLLAPTRRVPVNYEKARYDQIRIVPKGPPRSGTEGGRDPMRTTVLQIPVAEPMEKLYARPVTKELRKIVREIYTQTLRDMTASKDASVSVNTTIERAVLESEPIPYPKYERYNYIKWLGQKHNEDFLRQIDVGKVRAKVEKEVTKNEKFEIYLDYLVDTLNNYQKTYWDGGVEVKAAMGFTATTSAEDILGVLRSKMQETATARRQAPKGTSSQAYSQELFDGFAMTFLQKKVGPGYKPIQGDDLAIVIRDLLTEFLRRYPPNIDSKVAMAIDRRMSRLAEKYKPTREERDEFKNRVIPSLKKAHAEAMAKYEASKLAYAKDQERQARDATIRQNLSTRARVIEDQVMNFEANMYAKYGAPSSQIYPDQSARSSDSSEHCIYVYLARALVPYVFMKGLLAPHAKIFRAKVSNGAYDFSLMGSANLAHFLPEFVMSAKFGSDGKTEALWESAGNVIQTLLTRVIDEVLGVYYNTLYPSQRRETQGQFMFSAFEADALVDALADVHDVCQADTKTGYRPVLDRSGRPMKGGELQKIPDADLVICFDDITKKFSCHDSREVMARIRSGDRKNPITGTEFSSDFISRIETRYEEELDTGAMVPAPSQSARSGSKGNVGDMSLNLPPSISLFGVDSRKVLLFGDSIEVAGTQVPVTENWTSDSVMSVATFDYADRKSVSGVTRLKLNRGEKAYAIGVNAAAVTPQVRERLRAEISGKKPGVFNLKFSAPTSSTEDVETAIVAAVEDYAGL